MATRCAINYAVWFCSTHQAELLEHGQCPEARRAAVAARLTRRRRPTRKGKRK